MIKSKKILTIVMLFTLLLCLAGCSSGDYKKATQLMQEGKYEEAEKIFTELADYEDSANLVKQCQLKQAEKLISEGNPDDAKVILDNLGEYEGKAQVLKDYQYALGVKNMESADYESALDIFEALIDYKDCCDKALDCYYNLGQRYFLNKQYQDALEYYTYADDYKDAADMALESKYQYAKLLLNDNNYSESIMLFNELGDYKDSVSLFKEGCYQGAILLYNAENYSNAKDFFNFAGEDYKDSKEYLEKISALLGEKLSGTWKSKADISSVIKTAVKGMTFEGIDLNDYLDFSKLKMSVTLVFNDDNSFKLSMDSDSVITNLKQQFTDYFPAMAKNAITALAKKNGNTLDQVLTAYGIKKAEELVIVMFGITVEQYLENGINEAKPQIDAAKLSLDGTYSYDNGVLTLNRNDGTSDSLSYDIDNEVISYDLSANGYGVLKFSK